MPPNISHDLSTLAIARATELALIDFGLAVGGSNTTVQDTKKHWAVNVWTSGQIKIIKPNGNEYTRNIASNTADTVTFAALPVGVAVVAGDIYSIVNSPTLANLLRWGRDVSPAWPHAVEQVAPGALTELVTQAVTAGRLGYIYGLFISTQEGNDFLLNWVSGGNPYSKRFVFGGAGSIEAVDQAPINEGLPADAGTDITITNVNAGGAGMVYQADLLYGEI